MTMTGRVPNDRLNSQNTPIHTETGRQTRGPFIRRRRARFGRAELEREIRIREEVIEDELHQGNSTEWHKGYLTCLERWADSL